MKTVRVNGKQPSGAQAEELKAALAKLVAAGVTQCPAGMTVDDGLERWLRVHSIGNKPRSIEFNQSVVRYVRQHWPELQTPISAVTEAQCVTFATAIAHYAPARYNAAVNAIRSFVQTAHFLPRKSAAAYDPKLPTPEEFDRLLAALDTAQNGHAGLMVRFLAHTGLRINEARQLRWSDIREDHIYAPADVTKNGRSRCVPFIQGTREVLKALRMVSRGERVLPHGRCYKALRYASRLAGLPRYGHHTWRHYFATRCILCGVDIPTVAKWLGHLDGGVLLLKTYCHLLDEHSMPMAQRVKLGGNLTAPESFVTVHAATPAVNGPSAASVPAEEPSRPGNVINLPRFAPAPAAASASLA
jgi:site-specific recombinase XerD